MSLAAIAIGSLLLGQAASAPVEHSLLRSVSPSLQSPAVAAPPAATSPGQTAASARPGPATMLAQSLALPPDSVLTGRPVRLLSLLSLVQDRRRQLELTHAYWRLVEAVANYSLCLQENHRLERLPSSGEGGAGLRAARDSLAASLEEAAADAVTAQHELAGLMSLPAAASLPLPADPPHVGLYNTYFREIFASAAPPPRVRLLDRLLPLRPGDRRSGGRGPSRPGRRRSDPRVASRREGFALGGRRRPGGTPPAARGPRGRGLPLQPRHCRLRPDGRRPWRQRRGLGGHAHPLAARRFVLAGR